MRTLLLSSLLLVPAVAAHADTMGTLPLTGTFQNGYTISGTIATDDTTGTAENANLTIQTGTGTLTFTGPAINQRPNPGNETAFDYFDAQGDDLALAVMGSGVYSTSSFCTIATGCQETSSLEFSATSSTFLMNATPSASTVTPEPSSLALLGTGLLGIGGMLRRKFLA